MMVVKSPPQRILVGIPRLNPELCSGQQSARGRGPVLRAVHLQSLRHHMIGMGMGLGAARFPLDMHPVPISKGSRAQASGLSFSVTLGSQP